MDPSTTTTTRAATATVHTDPVLVLAARRGDGEAFAELYRRHSAAALRLARSLGCAADVEDIVSVAFTAVMTQIAKGRGPQLSFRAYVLTVVRHESWRHRRESRRVVLTADFQTFGPTAGHLTEDPDPFEHDEVRRAYSSLHRRWRHVLWQLEVEGRRPQDVAAGLGLSANAVSALAYRARAGLRSAYLEQGRSDAA